MENVDLNFLRNQWKTDIGYYWERAQKEIEDYFEMINYTLCIKARHLKTKSREQVLKDFSLDEEILKDPIFIPEILLLLEYIKKNNYDEFPYNWVSENYNHRERASYIYNYIIPRFQEVAEKVLKSKAAQYNRLYKEPKMVNSNKIFINKDFEKYSLLQYEHHISLINNITYHDDFFVILPILLRTLFENILYDIFKNSLNKRHTNLYFDEKNNRAADFSVLIELLNLLSQSAYKDIIRSNIYPKVIKILKDIKNLGNLSVHEVVKKITKKDVDTLHDEIDLVLEALLNSYHQLKGLDITIQTENLEKILVKLGLKEKINKDEKKIRKKERRKKIEQQGDISISDISTLMSDIRLLMKNEPPDYIVQIQIKMDELLLKVKSSLNERQRAELGRVYILFFEALKSQFKKTAETLFNAINIIILGR
jgi:hypothetical protein